jgi:hypothetical protein
MVNMRFNLGFKLVSLIAATHVLTEQHHIPDLLSIALGILGILTGGTLVPIDSLLDQDWFDGCVSKDDAGSEQTKNHGDAYLHCRLLSASPIARTSRRWGKVDRHIRFAFETSKDPMGSSDCSLGGTHVSTGLKLIFRRRGAGLSSEPCSQDSMELTLFSDMMAEGGGFQ